MKEESMQFFRHDIPERRIIWMSLAISFPTAPTLMLLVLAMSGNFLSSLAVFAGVALVPSAVVLGALVTYTARTRWENGSVPNKTIDVIRMADL
jgi:hypothetical protein